MAGTGFKGQCSLKPVSILLGENVFIPLLCPVARVLPELLKPSTSAFNGSAKPPVTHPFHAHSWVGFCFLGEAVQLRLINAGGNAYVIFPPVPAPGNPRFRPASTFMTPTRTASLFQTVPLRSARPPSSPPLLFCVDKGFSTEVFIIFTYLSGVFAWT